LFAVTVTAVGPLVEVTVNATEAVCVSDPLVPVTVNVEVAAGVELAVVTVIVDVPEPPLIEAGLKLAEAPEGKPLALNATVPLNPPSGLAVTV
jgi:hypothetical protein